ncbi:hypothetical protein QQ054_32160 [Oscillatoria amoena NRMC-F 0135]|nr:hypothetical protein [Oscillatoria amoena NRMC-F 0135]
MGVEQWAKLQADYDAESVDANHLALLELAQGANIHFAYLDFSFEGSFQISDAGFHTTNTAEMRPLYQWEKIEFRKQRYAKGWDYLERIFLLLNSKKNIYTDWAGSSTYQIQKSNFLFSAKDFSKYRTIDGYATFTALKGAITEVEDSYLKSALGAEFYDELKAEVLADNVSADNLLLMHYIKEAVAHLSVYTAGEELQFTLTEKGLRVSSTETQSGNIAKDAAPADTQLAIVYERSKMKGQEALEQLRGYLNANATAVKYPLYFNSSLYPAPGSETGGKYKNTDKSTFSKVWF